MIDDHGLSRAARHWRVGTSRLDRDTLAILLRCTDETPGERLTIDGHLLANEGCVGVGANGAIFMVDTGQDRLALKLFNHDISRADNADAVLGAVAEVALGSIVRSDFVMTYSRLVIAPLPGDPPRSFAYGLRRWSNGVPAKWELHKDRSDLNGAFDRLATGLDDMHAVGIVHRDVRPANVLIGDGDACWIDLGSAHREATGQGRMLPRAEECSPYAPAEVRNPPGKMDRNRWGRPADVFAFAAIMCHLATCLCPLDDNGALTESARTALETCPRLSRDRTTVIQRMLVSQPADRIDMNRVITAIAAAHTKTHTRGEA